MDGSQRGGKYADIKEENLTPQDAFLLGAKDFNFFAGLCIPHIIRFPFPSLYVQLWILIVSTIGNEERTRVIRYALGLPRGFAKTTFLKILAAWLIVYDRVNFLLIVGSTENLAQNFVSDLNEILGSPNMEAVYGAWTINLALDNKEEKKAAYRRRTVIIKAAGAGTAVRGINLAHERPDFLLCDDMQTKENAQSETESEHLLDWFTGTLLKVIDPFFATIIYSGNMYPQNCILAKLQENPYWVSIITGAILSDGKSLWEEVKPLSALYEEFCHDEALGKGHIWFAEMMNQPLLDRISLLPEGTIPTPTLGEDQWIPYAGFLTIDPAGLKKTSDDNVIAACYILDGIHVGVKKLIVGECDSNYPARTPLDVIRSSIKIATELGIRVILVEGVAYQSTLIFWFNQVLEKEGLQNHFQIIEVSPRGQHKERRIITSVQNLLQGSWFFMDSDARQRYIYQALAYKIGRPKQKDDILDACAYIEEARRPEHWSIINSLPLNGLSEESGILCGELTPF